MSGIDTLTSKQKTKKIEYIPEAPGGSVLADLAVPTEEEAWQNLLRATGHMPYRNKQDLISRGYVVRAYEWEE